MFIAKLLAHRLFLLTITLFVIAIIGVLMVSELQLFLAHHYHESLETLREQEEGIAILLVGFGVLLEGRHILQNWVAQKEVETSETTHHCEYYGFVLLALGLIIEMVEQLTKLVHIPDFTFWSEILINYPINLYALFLLSKVAFILADAKSDLVESH